MNSSNNTKSVACTISSIQKSEDGDREVFVKCRGLYIQGSGIPGVCG